MPPTDPLRDPVSDSSSSDDRSKGSDTAASIAEILRRTPLFQDLDDSETATLASLFVERRVASQTRLFSHGDASDTFFLVVHGAVSMFRDEVGRPLQLLARLGPGEFFGEMGLFDDSPRSATARTTEPTRLLTVPRATLLDFLDRTPDFALKLQIAAARRHGENVTAALDLGQRREVRIRIDRRIGLELPDGRHLRVTVENLSAGGTCLAGAPTTWRKGEDVSGTLHLLADALPIRGRVAWREGERVGVAFELLDTAEEDAVADFLRRLLA